MSENTNSAALKPKQSSTRKVKDRLLSFDKFSHDFHMTFDAGRKSVATWTGVMLSLLLLVLIIGYFVSKLQVLILKTDTNITIATSQYHFTDEDIFGT